MRKQENSQIVETAKEARGAELGPTSYRIAATLCAFSTLYRRVFPTPHFAASLVLPFPPH